MTTERKIDWQIARLDGEIFPRWTRCDSGPLIELAAPADAPQAAPTIRDTPVICDTLAGVGAVIARPPASHARRRLTAVGLAGGALLTSFCAMAFPGGLIAPARTASASDEVAMVGAAPEVQPLPGAMPALETFPVATSEVAVPEAAPSSVTASAPRALPVAAPIAPMVLPTGVQVLTNELAMLGAAPADIDRPGAAVALAVAGRRAAACTDLGDPRTTMPVSVTFAPSGRAISARVDGGPFLGTTIGSCVTRALRSATVREFTGSPVTIHGSVQLR